MYKIVKRGIDVLLSFVGLVIMSPVIVIVAVLIKVESKGPIIFKQKRIGLSGKVFDIYKFRSMCEGAESKGSGVYSNKNDARVTKVGKIIRITSIDELPQFFNIIKGDMSLIGPRPVLTYHPWDYSEYTSEQLKRFSVRPGVTGLAQINGRKELEWNRRIEYDVEYTEKLSFLFDVKIFFNTIIKVLTLSDNENIGVTVNTNSNLETENFQEDTALVEGGIK